MRNFLFIVLILALAGWAATGEVLFVAVQDNGYCAAVKFDNLDTGGVWRFNKGANNTPTDSTPFLTIKSLGYDNTGARIWRNHTVYIDTVFRKNYPLNGFDSVSIDNADTVWYMHLSDPVFVSDTIKGVSFYKRIYYLGADTQQSYSAETATNNSTVTTSVVKPFAKWTWPERSCYDTSFWVSMTGFHESADSGKMLETVIFSATDNHSHTFLDTITTSVSENHPYTIDSLKVEEYRCLINTDTFTKGDSITVNFKAFPRRGDSLYTGDGVNTTKPTPLYAPQYYSFAEYYHVMIDSLNGTDATGAVTAHDDFVLGAPYNACKTWGGAINRVRSVLGTAEIGGTRFHVHGYTYNYFGETVTSGTKASFNVEFINYPGETVTIAAGSGSTSMPVASYLKFHGIKFAHSTGNITFLEKSIWIDSCFDNRTGGSLCYYNPANYATNCKFNYSRSSPSSTNNDPFCIMRGCEFKYGGAYTTITAHCFIGNWTSHLATLILRLEHAGSTAPKPDGSIIGWNKICGSASPLEIYNDSSNAHGLLLINNIFEKTTTGTALITIAGGNNSMDVRHVLEIGNTYVGERQNKYYNDVALTDSTNLRLRRYCASYNNIYVKRTLITDKDAHGGAAGNQRFGNWYVEWGTSHGSNIYVSDPSFVSDGFGFNWLRPNVTFSNNGDMNNWVKFVDDKSYTGSAAGFGDYHLAATSPAIAFSTHWKTKYDIDGNERDSTGAIGAYGYEEGSCPKPNIGSTTFACTSGVVLSEKSITVSDADSLEWIDAPPEWLTLDTVGAGMGNLSGTPTGSAVLDTFRVRGIGCEGDSLDTGMVVFSVYETPSYTLTIINDGHGTTAPSGSVVVAQGAGTAIAATSSTGWGFVNWTVTAGTGVTFASAADSTTTCTLSAGNATVKANFNIDSFYVARVAGLGGAVTTDDPDSIYFYGSTARVIVTPNDRYIVVGGDSVPDTLSWVVTKDSTVSKTFEYNGTQPRYTFALLGQSNMAGYGGGPPYVDANYRALEWVGGWIHLEDPIYPTYGRSLAPAFANYLISNDSTEFYGIVCGAVGAKGITDTWSDTANATYKTAHSKVDSASDSIDALLFWAGEQDINDLKDSITVHDSTTAMINHFRRDYGDSIPIIIVLPSREDFRNLNLPTNNGILSACEGLYNVHVCVDAAYYPSPVDFVHISGDYLDTVGRQLAQKWIETRSYYVVGLGVVGATAAIILTPKGWMSSQNFTSFLYTLDMGGLDTNFWNACGESDATVAVYDHVAGAKIPRVVKNYSKSGRNGMIYFSAPVNVLDKPVFTIETGATVNETNDTSAISVSGIVGYWPMDEGAGATLYDLMGKKNMSATNIAWGTGLVGSSVVFNGTTSEAHVATEIIGSGAVTVECMYYVEGASENAFQRLIDNGKYVFNHDRIEGSTDLQYLTRNGATNANFGYSFTMDDKWIIAMMPSDASGNCRGYWNGFYLEAEKSSGTPEAGTGGMYVGNSAANNRTLNGKMQHVAIYNEEKGNHWAHARTNLFTRPWYDQEFEQVFIVTLNDGVHCFMASLDGDLVYTYGDSCRIRITTDAGWAYKINGGVAKYSTDTLRSVITGTLTYTGVSYVVPVIDSIKNLRRRDFEWSVGRVYDTLIIYSIGSSFDANCKVFVGALQSTEWNTVIQSTTDSIRCTVPIGTESSFFRISIKSSFDVTSILTVNHNYYVKTAWR